MQAIRVVNTVLVLGVVAGVLSGCSASAPVDPLAEVMASDVDPRTPPAFLDSPQLEADVLPGDGAISGIEPDSTRYQGEWGGRDIYLGVSGTSTVNLVTVDPSETKSWSVGSSTGNSPLGTSAWDDDDVTLVYLPQGSASAPEGWEAFSPYMIARAD